MVNETDLRPLEIREEAPGDLLQIRHVNQLAFERTAEADLIDRLRQTCPDFDFLRSRSRQADCRAYLVYACLVGNTKRPSRGDGLGSAVGFAGLPKAGHWGKLIQAGLGQMQKLGWPFVIVLGHPGYYPRFGFETASKYGIRCEYDAVPEEAFMIIVFDPSCLPPGDAVAHYRPEWAEAT